ncbi:hypothetical protein [Erwinia billingiae]|uniref:hypothetical protein n=1 Tax=Erwinia billingiae TaxID=182337 RepID=UPI0021581249|nr:hypothetical protein [Erwinia billingiae]
MTFMQRFLPPLFFDFLKKLDIDESLDARDGDPFDSQWMDNFNRLEKNIFDEKDFEIINKIRECVFKQSLKVIGSHEISGRISDDFEIIAKDFALEQIDHWPVSYLWKSYQNSIFPK